MSQIVNNDKLTFILTQYGLDRVAEALSDPSVNLYISKIKLGTGSNYEYYEPQVQQSELKGLITAAEFPISDKALLEDNLTVSFHAVIPENFGGYDIREVGLYETLDGVDYLFAIGTQQPFIKPVQADNYLINIDYYIFLKSQNFADVYDSIILDPESQLVTKEHLEDLMSTVLFAQGNLMDQIGHNSDVIGLNRASQLHDKIKEEIRNFSYVMTYNSYADLIDIASVDSVYSYWVFNYPRRSSAVNSIIDIGKNGYNLSSDQSINLYNREYSGFMSMLNFDGSHYYYLSADANLTFLNSDKTADTDFTMIFTVKGNGNEAARTLLAKSNYSTGAHVFEVQELTDRRLCVKLFADSNNYITYTTGTGAVPADEHSLIISYKAEDHNLIVYINGKEVGVTKTVTGTYNHMSAAPTTLYGYSATPLEVKYANNSTTPTTLHNADGSPNLDTNWTISNNQVFYKETLTTYDSSRNVTVGGVTYYAFVYTTTAEYIWANSSTTPTVLYNSNGNLYMGTDWTVTNNTVKYKTYTASYSSAHNVTIPTLEATSYIMDVNGNKSQFINSWVGVASIIKKQLTKDQMRELSLMLLASMGQNPCVDIYQEI